MWRYPLPLLIGFALSFVGHLPAQEPIDTVLGRLAPGKVVRVSGDGSRTVGRLMAIDTARRAVRFEGSANPQAWESIDSLWVRGNAAKKGAIIGVGVAGVSSFVLAAIICEGVSEGRGCDEWGTVTGLAVGGAVGGGLIGGAIGLALPSWRRRYARERSSLLAGVDVTVQPGGRLGFSLTLSPGKLPAPRGGT